MPAIVPHTSTYALTNATLSYGLELADRDIPEALKANAALAKGLNTYKGNVTHDGVSTAFGLSLTPVEEVIGG
jgi:alanine dehydrogenase